ncbi:M23 family metallopeptidase [Streptomyces stramineus]
MFRLAEEAGRARQRYERVRRAARAQRARAAEIGALLRNRRIVSAILRDDVGAAARAQYRTGGFTAVGSTRAADDPVELVDLQAPAVRRRARLGRLLDQNVRAGRQLAAEERSLAASRPALDKDTERLRTAELAAEKRLAAARGELNAMAQAAVASGNCVPLDSLDGLAAEVGAAAGQEEAVEGDWARPVTAYRLTAGFGGVGANWAKGHTGQDFAVPIGTPVRSIGAGTVVAAGCGGPFGISMVVRHEGGWYSQYAHLSAPFVTPGQELRAGQWLGLSGTTGNSTGPHLHFEIRTTPGFGSAVDPVRWLGARGVRL